MTIFKLDAEFYELVDELITKSKTDCEILIGLLYIKRQSLRHGVTFYEEFFHIMQQVDVELKAKEWVKSKSINKIEMLI